MNREGHNQINFFHGIEVEHTPALGKKTLFVVGVQPTADIVEKLQGCEHIYFGANQSFPNLPVNDGGEWAKWENMIWYFLEKDYWCTLDIDIQCVEGLLEAGFTEHHKFIPMISAKLPYIGLLGYNAVLKLDDKDFGATNPGVWCHNVHDLMNRAVFTDWDCYSKDEVLK